MNMRGDNMVKRRGKTKQFRGKKQDFFSGDIRMIDFNWGGGYCPSVLSIPEGFNQIKGIWAYPKKGFIQWKNQR